MIFRKVKEGEINTMTSLTATRDEPEATTKATPSGSQTLLRGLDVLDAVAEGPISLAKLAQTLELTRSTTHRLAAALVERNYLTLTPREGYQLGPKLLELGHLSAFADAFPHQLSGGMRRRVALPIRRQAC